MAHSEAKIFITAAQYAKLINRSVWTARRRIAKRDIGQKVGGRWVVEVPAHEVRYFRRAMVEEIRNIGSRIGNAPWGSSISHLTSRRAVCNEMLIVLGSSDILVELDRARCNAGIQTAKSRQQYRAALDAIERMIAA